MEDKHLQPASDVFSSYAKLLFKDASLAEPLPFSLKESLDTLMERARAASVQLDLIPELPTLTRLVTDMRNVPLQHVVEGYAISTPEARETAHAALCKFFRETGNGSAIVNVLGLMLDAQLEVQDVGNKLLSAGAEEASFAARKVLHFMQERSIPLHKDALFALVKVFSSRLDAQGCREVLQAVNSLKIAPSGSSPFYPPARHNQYLFFQRKCSTHVLVLIFRMADQKTSLTYSRR
jgi:hypothetical protein